MKLQIMDASIVPVIESVNKVFLHGPFGVGKTSLAIQRIEWLLQQENIHGSEILVLTPQRALRRPYYKALRRPSTPSGSPVTMASIASMSRRSVELYWPLIAENAGFTHPDQEPVFLNLETSQYHMAPLVDEALIRDGFAGIRVDRSRIISQILDNLNKAALNGYTIDEVYRKLELTVPPGRHRVASINALKTAHDISASFRRKCLDQNLLNYSLQIELFNDHILTQEWVRTRLLRSYRHLIADNVEEDTYTAYRLLRAWLPHLDSALLISDDDGGLRVFLGAYPEGVDRLRAICDEVVTLNQSRTMSPPIQLLERSVYSLFHAGERAAVQTGAGNIADSADTANAPALFMPQSSFRFFPQMVEWVADQIASLITDQGVEPEQIVILAPYLSDALKFSLQNELDKHNIPSTSHRPSRPLRIEPAAKAMLTLAVLSRPHWGIHLDSGDIATMLLSTISTADPVRASLLAKIVYRPNRRDGDLVPFESLDAAARDRVTYRFGEQYDRLREWLLAYRAESSLGTLDQFWTRLFGEILSQPGFVFHGNTDSARVANQLIVAARNFRWAIEPTLWDQNTFVGADVGREFYHFVDSGAIGATAPADWEQRNDAVLIAPAYTYIMRNQAVGYQFWLDIGSTGWWERLYQPLTHPHVLSPEWPTGKLWTDYDEYQARQQSMRRLVLGLIRRTSTAVYMGLAEYNESGYEQQGPLLTAVNHLVANMGSSVVRV